MDAVQLILTPHELHTVQHVLRTCAPHHQALVFGSRVQTSLPRKACKNHSDLDIALAGPNLTLHDMFALRDAFSDVVMRDDLPAQWMSGMVWAPL
jgi:predicted nucleotidyltransferase